MPPRTLAIDSAVATSGVDRRSVSHVVARGFAALAMAIGIATPASAQVRSVSWNLARLNGDATAIGEVLATLAEDDRPGFAVAPAILVFQEITSQSLSEVEQIVAASAPDGIEYQLATWTSSPSEDGSGGAATLFFRTDLLEEVAADHRDLSTGAGRQTDRWRLRLVDYPDDLGTVWVYGSHLKASSGSDNEAQRLAGAEVIRTDIASLPADSMVILAGDLNFYSNSEDGYQHLIAGGDGGLEDPLGTGSWSGQGNSIKHTQSPRDAAGGGLVGGSLDDRFDFQLVAAALLDDRGLDLIPGTYRSVGNDGNHYNEAINAGTNTYFPGEATRSDALADALFDASDHVPVAVDLRLPGILVASLDDAIGRVIRNSTVPIDVVLANAAPAETSAGSLPIEVEVTAVEGAFGTASATAPLLPQTATAALQLDTSMVGEIDVLVVAEAGDGVANRVFPMQAQATVIRPAVPSLRADAPVEEILVEVEVPAGSPIEIGIEIFNLGYGPLQSVLEIDEIFLSVGPATIVDAPTFVADTPGVVTISVDPGVLSPKGWSGVLDIEVSDENIPGETFAALSVSLTLIPEIDTLVGDLDGNGLVNGADLSILLGNWGSKGGVADLDGNGLVNGADLSILLGHWTG
ncbi:MAG: endonuclease/exonuclease/phosphatase family protein [Phycisphaerales bacterium]